MANCPYCGWILPETQIAIWCPNCAAQLAPGPPTVGPWYRPFPVAKLGHGELFQKMAGGLALTSGVLLLLAVPLTYSLLTGFLGPEISPTVLGPYLVCSLSVHVFLAFGAFWGAYRGLKFLLAGGSMLLVLGLGALFASLFFLGSLLGLVSGLLLIVAATLVYSS